MHRADRIIGLLFLCFGAYLVISSREFAYWQDFGPGTGYFPFWLGVMLIILSVILLVQVFFSHKTKKEKGFGFDKGSMYPCAALIGMFVCFLLMEHLGFILPVVLFVLVFMEILEPKKWMLHAGVAVSTGLILYFVFSYWMGIPFPTGVLGI